MSNEVSNMPLVEKNADGKVVLADYVENVIDLCEKTLKEAQANYDSIKEQLINAMLDNNIKTAHVGKYKFSVREPKEKWHFDADKFMTEEDEKIVVAFSTLESSCTETFDIEKFKKECPEVYAKYVTKKEEERVVVDEHKLWSTLTDVWKKYATKEEPKPATITIKNMEE